MTIDTSRTIAISGAPWKMLGLGLLGIGMTLLSLAIAVPLLPSDSVDVIGRFFGVIGALFFGFCTLVIFWRAITTTGPVIELTPTGLRDRRVAASEIPWAAVRGISTWSAQGQKIMVLDVDPAVEQRLGLSAMTRMTRRANRALGADGLCVSAQGLRVGYEELLQLTAAYAAAHGGGRPGAV